MKVSVVLPAYNAGEALARCLSALRRQRLDDGDALEVVVVDDGSTDGTGALVERHAHGLDLNYVFKPRTAASGRSAARNTGVQQATGELVVLIDPDHVFPAGLLAEHLRYHEHSPDLVVLGPRGRIRPDEADQALFLRDWSFARLPALSQIRDVRLFTLDRTSDNLNNLATCWHYAFSCNLSVRREHLLAVGGFDEGFTGWGLEDSELGYRLRRHGLAFAFNPDALIYTWELGGKSPTRFADWQRNLRHFEARHPDLAVTLEWLLADTMNPDLNFPDGVGRYLRFEYAARAAAGRVPYAGPYPLVEVTAANVDQVLASLPALAGAGNVLIFDDSADRRLGPAVQCQDSEFDLLYFARPAPSKRARIRAAYPIVPWPQG